MMQSMSKISCFKLRSNIYRLIISILMAWVLVNAGYCCNCDNDPIVINSFYTSSYVYNYGDSITFTVDATDMDVVSSDPCVKEADSTLFYHWGVGGDTVTTTSNSITALLPPGRNRVYLSITDDPTTGQFDEGQCPDYSGDCYREVLVVEVNMRTDSNNDDMIDCLDEYVEDLPPGKRIQIDGDLARVDVTCDANWDGYIFNTVTLTKTSGDANINVWSEPEKINQITLPFSADILDGGDLGTFYVEGLSSGDATLEMTLSWDGYPWASDSVTFTSGGPTRVKYVKHHDDPPFDGLSWETAYTTIAEALTDPQFGDEIWVASGTYPGCITLPAGVSIYGGFDGDELERPDWITRSANPPTILDGQSSGSVITVASGATPSTVIDCLQIQNGSGTCVSGTICNGGGIYCYGSSPTISHNNILLNSLSGTSRLGGGIYLRNGSDRSMIVGNKIHSNSCASGGGIYASTCPTIMLNNLIYENTASGYGGGIFCIYGNPVITNNTIAYNTSSSSPNSGGGIFCNTNGYIAYNIVAFNTTGIFCTLNSGLFFNDVYSNPNTTNPIDYYPPLVMHDYDISSDPAFVNVALDDYHLQSSSPCIDAAGYEETSLVDFDGELRPVDGDGNWVPEYDLGADEYQE